MQQPAWSKCQSQYIIPNSLTETIYMVFLTLSFAYLIYKVIFYFLYLKKICSKCKLQFLAKNLRKSLTLNGLRLVWPILYPKNTLSFLLIVSSFKRPFCIHVSHKISKFTIFFSLPCLYTKVNRLPTCHQIWSSEGEIIKSCSIITKKQQWERNLWNTFWLRSHPT